MAKQPANSKHSASKTNNTTWLSGTANNPTHMLRMREIMWGGRQVQVVVWGGRGYAAKARTKKGNETREARIDKVSVLGGGGLAAFVRLNAVHLNSPVMASTMLATALICAPPRAE